ncbi:TIGR04282 family arsenosugar biosynthesis glycosyltransferase [Lysobacter sp. D1-1-M9]|uniref:TIGR04282 family arsenosugar biosynthesis glycosyltransferase n=1 Tax=Novilysobacter longmucuonensis TaxID=3098603 RepID=UPI002FC90625
MSGALAIFVKTPGHSAVKSRLAADRGERYAQAWYRHAAAAVASVARSAQARHGLTAYWAVAEPEALGDWPELPALAQGGGELGERMARVHAQLVARHGSGLLIGADAPQLTVQLLGEAGDWLASASPRLALGPASDGGFWLFGANMPPPLPAWTQVRYSADDTARQFRRNMEALGAWRTLATLTDADHGHDLTAVLHALETLPEPTAEQRSLADWMGEQERTCEDASDTSAEHLLARHPREGGDPVPPRADAPKSLGSHVRGNDEVDRAPAVTAAPVRSRP